MHDPSPACMDAVIGLIIYAYYHRDVDVIVYGGPLSVRLASSHSAADRISSSTMASTILRRIVAPEVARWLPCVLVQRAD